MKLQDYIHYYIGCKVIGTPYGGQPTRFEEGIIVGVHLNVVDVKFGKWQSIATLDFDKVKLILRKLGDHEDGELNEYQTLVGKRTDGIHSVVIHYDTSESFHWLLKKGFDLFGLIEAGLAVDKKVYNKNNNTV